MAEHSPLPWTQKPEELTKDGYHIAGRSPILISDSDGSVAKAYRMTEASGRCKVAEANAEFIVRAANSFDDLVAACKASMEFVTQDMAIDLEQKNAVLTVVKQLRAALAKAGVTDAATS